MKKTYVKIDNIPATIWGNQSDTVYLYIHGQGGSMEDADFLSKIVCQQDYQILSIDLPKHGTRTNNRTTFVPWEVVPELITVMEYVKKHWSHITLFANSIGAYFSMLSFHDAKIDKALFVSPILDMKQLISNMMVHAGVSKAQLEQQQVIETTFGQTLYWEYWQYVVAHPIIKWKIPTEILYGENDTMVERSIIDAFTQKFSCDLTVMENGEHWFHTQQQLEVLKNWVNKIEPIKECKKDD